MNGQMAMEEMEPGQVDNRLSLTVTDHPEIEKWTDGDTYVFDRVKVRQISAGEFEVLSSEGGRPAEPEEESPTAAEETEEPVPTDRTSSEPPGRYGNPAIDRLMMRGPNG